MTGAAAAGRAMRLSGRKAVVTGAATGIGRAIALKLAAEGCDIGLFDLDPASTETTADAIRATGRSAATAIGDVAVRGDVNAATGRFLASLGQIDILVNNAGILRTAPFLDVSESEWDLVLRINLNGAFHFSQAVLPGMVKQGHGAIINMSSWTGKKGVPNHAAYSASKAAVIALTQSLAGEFSANGIRINAVCPGIIVNTAMRDQAEELNRAQGLPDVHSRAMAVPMRRPGTPEEVADVVAFLASAESGYMTGQAINITGGLWMN